MSELIDRTVPTPYRECDCQEWVIRCAHHEGLRLCMAGPSRLSWIPVADEDYRVSLGYEDAPSCCQTCAAHGARQTFETFYVGNSDADALAAFYAAEEQLLHGLTGGTDA